MRSKRALLAAAAVGMGLLAGCVSHQVDDHSFQFNEATGSLTLRLLLLNAVRASKDYPLQFSRISTYQGKGTVSGQISASLPLKIPANGEISPRVDLNDGISRIDLIDLNTEEAQQALKKTLPLRVYRYYDSYGGSRSYMGPVMLMVENFAMPKRLYYFIGSYVNERCKEYLGEVPSNPKKLPRFEHNRYACSELRRLAIQCPRFDRFLLEHPNEKIALLQNHVTSECQHVAFVAATLYLAVVGGTVGPAESDGKGGKGGKSGKGGKGDGGRSPSSAKKAPGNTFNIYVTDDKKGGDEKGDPDKEPISLPFYDQVFAARCLALKLCIRKPDVGTMALDVKIQLRSPERLVRFLGELISAQSYGEHRFIPFGVDPIRRERYKLLVVERGSPPLGRAVVSVTAPDGETIYVPRRDPDGPKQDISLELLSIVSDVLNGAVSKKAYPPVTTLTVSP
jgi:hypothetical protein